MTGIGHRRFHLLTTNLGVGCSGVKAYMMPALERLRQEDRAFETGLAGVRVSETNKGFIPCALDFFPRL